MFYFENGKKILNERVLGAVVYLVGATLFQWPVATIIYLFWFEAVLIGVFTIIKMKKSEGSIDESENYSIEGGTGKHVPMTKRYLVTLFTLLYFPTIFFLGFVLLVFNLKNVESQSIQYGLLFMILYMTISYFVEFVWSNKYKDVSPPELLVLPFTRYVTLFIFVFIGIWVTLLGRHELLVLCVLIVSKVVIEQYFFQWNEKRISKKKISLSNSNKL